MPGLSRSSRLRQSGYTLEALFVLWGVRLALYLLPYHRVKRLFQRSAHVAPRRSLAAVLTNFRTAVHFTPKATCLVQAVAGQHLLASYGYASVLHLGVARAHGKFKAHAWLCHSDVPVIGTISNLDEYRPLGEYSTVAVTRRLS